MEVQRTSTIFLAVTTIPAHALARRRRPEDLRLHPDGVPPAGAAQPIPSEPEGITLRVALREHVLWWRTAALFLGTLPSVAIAVHLIPFLLSDGCDAGFAALATGLIGAIQVAARVLVTIVGNRVPAVVLLGAGEAR